MDLDPAWTAVIAALGASMLTGLASFGVMWRQERSRRHAAKQQEKAAVYGDLLARSVSLISRAGMLGLVVRSRTGVLEGLANLLYHRPPLDPMRLYDWLNQDLQAVTDAWSRIWAIGSQEAVDLANELALECGNLVAAATSLDRARSTLLRVIVGEPWSKAQQEQLTATVERLSEARHTFALLVRKELGERAANLTTADKAE